MIVKFSEKNKIFIGIKQLLILHKIYKYLNTNNFININVVILSLDFLRLCKSRCGNDRNLNQCFYEYCNIGRK